MITNKVRPGVTDETCQGCPQLWRGECRAYMVYRSDQEKRHRASGNPHCLTVVDIRAGTYRREGTTKTTRIHHLEGYLLTVPDSVSLSVEGTNGGYQMGRIRAERQQGPECALATVAALIEKPLAEVRERACQLAGVSSWDQVAYGKENAPRFWDTMMQLGREYGIERTIRNMASSGFAIPPAVANWRIPRKGRGTVNIKGEDGSHVMAYGNGLVHDSNSDYPDTLAGVMRHYPGYQIMAITPLAKDSRDRFCPQCAAKPGQPCIYPSGHHYSKGHSVR